MKQLKVILLLTLVVAFSQCKPSSTDRNSEDTKQQIPENASLLSDSKNCYLAVLAKDSVKLELEVLNGKFKGYLNYKLFETDNSIGYYEGVVRDDTLKGVYTFLSEGMISVADKYFLIKDNQLLEGIGEIEYPNDSTVKFHNPSRLLYGDSYVFEKIDCPENFIPKDIKEFYSTLD